MRAMVTLGRDHRLDAARRIAFCAADRLGVADVAMQPAAACPMGRAGASRSLARLATSPRVLLLDEPAAGLNEPDKRTSPIAFGPSPPTASLFWWSSIILCSSPRLPNG